MVNSGFICTPEWHFRSARKLSFCVYSFGRNLSWKDSRLFCSVESLSEYFQVSRWTMYRCLDEIIGLGFFELIESEPFKSTVYRVLKHEEWALEHPGECCQKIETGWEKDELGIRLRNISGGKITYKPFQIQALRNTGYTDEEILTKFSDFASDSSRPKRWSEVHFNFLKTLRRAKGA